MRLITWNCKGAFHRKHEFAAALSPDILIVPECEKPSGVQQLLGSRAVRSFEWFGTNPRKGMAVVTYGEYELQVHPSYEPSHQWIVPLVVTGPRPFILFAVWTLPLGGYSGRYVRPLLEAFESYKDLMASSEAVWAGDFNSNFVFDRPSRRYNSVTSLRYSAKTDSIVFITSSTVANTVSAPTPNAEALRTSQGL